jgi:peptide/nickel transport system substrate-binding protein
VYASPSAKGKLAIDWWYNTSASRNADLTVLLKAQLENTGMITVNLHGTDSLSYYKNVDAGTMQVFTFGWAPDYIDANDYVEPILHSENGQWPHFHYKNPQMD